MKFPEICRLEGVSFSFGSRELFKDVSLNVPEGSMVALAGKSGSGKSTLLYILGGFLKPSKGSYLFKNKEVYSFGEFGLAGFRRRNLGFVFQDFRLVSFLNVEQNVRLPLLFGGRRFLGSEIKQLLKDLGIFERRKASPRDISGGEAQRTAIARALALKPKLLLLDEPTGNLDEKTELDILEQLLALKKQGLSLVIVTHSANILARADYIWQLSDGEITVNDKKKPVKKSSKKKTAPAKTTKRKTKTTVKKAKTKK